MFVPLFSVMYHDNDISASGYVSEAYEGLGQTFTEIETLHTSEMNVVAKAKRYGRWWLLKGLRREVAGEVSYQQRLRKELEVLMQLQHPNVVNVAGMEHVDGLGECIVMEFVDGMTLREWLQGAPTRRQRNRVALELIEAVGYVHTKGIVHRDLKPGNIMITANGESVKLVDFGLADTDSHAILKQPAGTLRYMSPEQQQTAVADVRNDIYSIGVIFDEMNLGCRHVIRKCMLPLDRRYQHVAELRDAITTRQKRRTLAMVAGVLVLVLLLAGLVAKQMLRKTDFAQQAEKIYAEQESQKSTIALLTDSLEKMSATNRQLADEQERQRAARQRMENAVSMGKAEIDKVIVTSRLKQHFDTVSSYRYFNNDLYLKTFQAVDDTRKTYIQQLNGHYTEREISEINHQLMDYHSVCGEAFFKRIEQLRAKYERKTMQGN